MVSRRVAARIELDFPDGDAVAIAERLDAATGEPSSLTGFETGSERVQAAILILAAGDIHRLIRECDDARRDWRDVLVAAGLGFDDWPGRVDELLGPT